MKEVGGRSTYYCPFCEKSSKKIGITGSIATGKTYLSNLLKTKGQIVIDTDELSRIAFLTQEIKILKLFSTLDRKEIAHMIYEDEIKRKQLNALIHPLVLSLLKKEFKKCYNQLVFVTVPLLYEVHWQDYFDRIIIAYTNETKQLSQLMKRDNLNEFEARLRMNSQMNIEEKKEKGDFVLDMNDVELNKKIDNLLEVLYEL
jgi:dephospho-CoA kinase